jgi:cold shock CspA family protein
MSSVQETQPLRLLGQVKWFNNKAGYGFITVNDGEYAGKDIFIHYSTIHVTNSQYKYLVQGEYVEFCISKTEGGAHEFQATEISGIKGGAIMCETRRVSRESAPPRERDADADEDRPRPLRRTQTNSTRPAPRKPVSKKPVSKKPVESTDEEGFTTVKKKPVRKTE